MTSEELYFDDTSLWNNGSDSGVIDLAGYLGYPVDGSGAWPNPYRYGYIGEITNPTTAPTPEKRFALGRFSHENAVVMPDRKTVYLSDDGSNVGFFKSRMSQGISPLGFCMRLRSLRILVSPIPLWLDSISPGSSWLTVMRQPSPAGLLTTMR